MTSSAGTSVLVVGGAGYIGSHTCKALAHNGFNPITYDNLSHGHRWAVRWGPMVHGELADETLLEETLRRFDVQAVVHFAAYAYVGESMTDPGKYFENNVSNTLKLLRVMHSQGVDRIVFSSSCATYGIPDSLPISESHAQAPVNPYGESKLFVEKVLDWYDVAHNLRSVALRYFNAAGADPHGLIGEHHDPETHLIPLAIQAALGQCPHLDIYGTDHQTEDGTAVRDFVHVTDLASAHVSALEYLIAGGATDSMNLGTGRGHSVSEVVSMIEKISGYTVPVREAPRRPGDPPQLIADPRKAKSVLDWTPKLSSLETIIRTAWQWHASVEARMEEQDLTGQIRGFAERRAPLETKPHLGDIN
jgi:UDP-arabinose 4-epimerase